MICPCGGNNYNMKKFWIIVFIFVCVGAVALIIPNNKKEELENYEYLRIHIRANSNTDADQNIKYKIKDEMVSFLTPYLCDVPTKEEAIKTINTLTPQLKQVCYAKLRENGFNYSVNIKISNEYFPTRTYSNTTLESGYYDAVIVELGTATGDNWWCVMYPPLCFVNNFENSMQINFKSKIVEWFKTLFD